MLSNDDKRRLETIKSHLQCGDTHPDWWLNRAAEDVGWMVQVIEAQDALMKNLVDDARFCLDHI